MYVVSSYFPFGFEDRIWDLIVSVPGHCLSFYFTLLAKLTQNLLTKFGPGFWSMVPGFILSLQWQL